MLPTQAIVQVQAGRQEERQQRKARIVAPVLPSEY